MSWPTDGLPRYKAVSDSGSAGAEGSNGYPIGYVLDRGICQRIVYTHTHRKQEGAQRLAEREAVRLNAVAAT
jgi:hypothetical protein